MMKTELRVSQELLNGRKERMRRLLEMNAPDVIIANEAQILVGSFKFSWLNRVSSWKVTHWLLMAFDERYRREFHALES